MAETEAQPAKLSAYDFAAGLLSALARLGIMRILPPELDDKQLSDAAASARSRVEHHDWSSAIAGPFIFWNNSF